MKRVLSILLCVAMILSMGLVVFAAEETATMVTDASALKAGDRIIIVNQDGDFAMGSQGTLKYRPS